MIPQPQDAVARLSYDALRYGQNLAISNGAALARRLYLYNVIPIGASHRRRLERMTLDEYFGPGYRTAADAFAGSGWQQAVVNGWVSWHAPEIGSHAGHNFKLYLCPEPDALGEVLPSIAAVVAQSSAFGFKLPFLADGIYRPDKLLAYFVNHQDLDEAAAQLAGSMEDVHAQPAPFTAAVTANGLLSYACEPASESRSVSWRIWITRHLATQLLDARAAADDDGTEVWQRALAQAARDTLELPWWVPAPNLWKRMTDNP